MPSGAAISAIRRTEVAPARLTVSTAAAVEFPVASIGSSRITSRSAMSFGSFTKYSTGSSVSSFRYMPMKPTRAPGRRDSTASSIPTPARRIGQMATFFPEIRVAVMCSSGVSISTSSSARLFVASYVRSRVSSLTSCRNICVVVVTSRSSPSL